MTMILIFLLLPIALAFFLPFQFVLWAMAFCCAVIAVVFGCGSLYAFDITDADDWKMLFLSLLLPGGAAVGLYFLGKLLGDVVMMDLLKMIF